MSSPEVMQYQLINECFRDVLNKYEPKKIFVPGCTIGNGFENIKWEHIDSITALDINPEYIIALRNRYPDEKKLILVNEDFNKYNPGKNKFDLIIAALFFEYVELSESLLKLKSMMIKTSILFSMIQLPDEKQNKVTMTQYKSLEKLSQIMNLNSAEKFKKEQDKCGLYIISEIQKTLESGKSFLLTESTIK
jgi:hypothetical protein